MASPLFGQGTGNGPYVLQNYSNGSLGAAPTPTTLGNSTFGTTNSYGGWGVGINTAGALTYATPGGSCSTLPTNSGGTQALAYNTVANNGSGTTNFLTYNFPAGVSSAIASGWVCYNGTSTDTFSNSWDSFTLYNSGGSGSGQLWVGDVNGNTLGTETLASGGFSNIIVYNISGTQLQFSLEGGTGGAINFSPGTWYQYSIVYHPSSGSVGRLLIGDNNPDTKPGNHQMYFMNTKITYVGEADAQFPIKENPVVLSDGILSPARAMDWTKAGFNGGALPDTSWTQCGSTLAAGTYTGATITANMSGCGANTYYLLGSGTFNMTGMVTLPTGGHVVLRGSGATATKMVWTGTLGVQCGQLNAAVCIVSSDTTNIGSNPTRYNWTSGYTQGSNQITLSSTTGLNNTNPTILVLDECDTGFTGAGTCTGTASDNSQLYICGTQNTCSFNGGIANHRDQMEMHSITNIAGSVVTLGEPLIMPNWASGLTPQVWFFQPVAQNGVENFSIDISAIASGATSCVEKFNSYQSWISGVACNGARYGAFNAFESVHGIVQSNYLYTATGAGSCGPGDACGARTYVASYELIQNNISQGYFDGGVFFDGNGGIGNAVFANVVLKTDGNNGTLNNAITEHTTNEYNLFEENYSVQISQDSTHGLSDFGTRYRNHILGWESNPSNAVAGSSVVDCQGSRYANNVANVLGTPGYTTTYSTSANVNAAVYSVGNCGGTPPTDALTSSTSLRWASYDNVNAAVQFTSGEIPTGASTYPGNSPVFGNTGIGQSALPASLIYTSRPSWWVASIPFPAIGPDVSSGNIGQCSGAINTVGQFNGMPALTNAQCGSHGITASAWAGHVNAIPALACALNVMGMPPDGSGSVLSFDANACYGGGSSPIVTFTPSPLAFGQVPVGATGNLVTLTITNTGTANLTVSALNNATNFTFQAGGTCTAVPFTLTPSTSCTEFMSFSPTMAISYSQSASTTDNTSTSPSPIALTGLGTGAPALGVINMAGVITPQGTVVVQ